MRISPVNLTTAVLISLLTLAHPAAATTATFNFDNLPPYPATGTPFSYTNNGITASFSSPQFGPYNAGLFVVNVVPPHYTFTLTGNLLVDHVENHVLDVKFSKSLSSIFFLFGVNQPTASLSLYTNAGGHASARGIRYPGYPYYEGFMSFAGAPFNEVALVATTGAKFAIDNIVVRDTFQLFSTAASSALEPGSLGTSQLAALAVPEPSSLSFMLAGLTILFFVRRWSAAGRG